MKILLFCFTAFVFVISCKGQKESVKQASINYPSAHQLDEYLPLIKEKRVGVLVNQTSLVDSVHLIDTLLSRGANITKIFAPEHGFRGQKDAGEHFSNDVDSKTNIAIISLYGTNKKPNKEQLENVDVVVFDIQDVGVRFYTYISSMHYMMEACAENNKHFVVLDRPNPNGDYFEGPVLNEKYKSFVGMHPIPVVHGLTVGELATMINGERWLADSLVCDLTVIKMNNWTHNARYELPIKPSPNLPNYLSVRLYPSLCFFEATNVSIGRGTYFPFQVIGYPDKSSGDFMFVPHSIEGMANNPKQKDVECYGIDLRNSSDKHTFTMSYFISYYKKFGLKKEFGLNERWFNLLAGNDKLLSDIKAGKSESEIKLGWKMELCQYGILRDKYLLYPKEK